MSLIYLADDDEDDRDFFKKALDSIGACLKVKTASDGAELLSLLQANVPAIPDMIFLDINMPKLNGLEALSLLKANDRFKNIPVAILSTTGGNKSIKATYDGGAHFYMVKPVSFKELQLLLLTTINKLTGTAQRPALSDFVIG